MCKVYLFYFCIFLICQISAELPEKEFQDSTIVRLSDMQPDTAWLRQVSHYKKTLRVGSFITGAGILTECIGLYYLAKGYHEAKTDTNSFFPGFGNTLAACIILITGNTLVVTGTPVGIVGGVKLKKLYIGQKKVSFTLEF